MEQETGDQRSTESGPSHELKVDHSTPLARELAQENRRREKLRGKRLAHPQQTRIITVSNQKGGVGKTTTTVNLSAALARAGMHVLVVDVDPQGNASTALAVPHSSDVDSIYDVLIDEMPMAEVVQDCPDVEGLSVAPATIELAGAEIELVSLVAREQRLSRALKDYFAYREKAGLPRLDYVFVDCPPSLGLLTVNAMAAADDLKTILQAKPDVYLLDRDTIALGSQGHGIEFVEARATIIEPQEG